MRKIKLFLIVFAFFTTINTINAQIENEIKSFVDSTELLVNNGRKMLIQYLQTKEYNKMSEIYNYLKIETNKKNCFAFTYNEDLLITSLTNNWTEFLTQSARYSDVIKESLCYPTMTRDQLNGFLHREVKDNVSQLLKNVQNESLTNEDKDLLEIYF